MYETQNGATKRLGCAVLIYCSRTIYYITKNLSDVGSACPMIGNCLI